MQMKKLLMIFTVFILIFTCAHAEDEFLSVVDTADMISAPEEKYIFTMNKVLSETTGARIVVATAESTGELSVVEYAASLYDELGVGRIGRKNCVFLFLCEGAEDYHVIVSNGISASLTNDYAQKILVEYMENHLIVLLQQNEEKEILPKVEGLL